MKKGKTRIQRDREIRNRKIYRQWKACLHSGWSKTEARRLIAKRHDLSPLMIFKICKKMKNAENGES